MERCGFLYRAFATLIDALLWWAIILVMHFESHGAHATAVLFKAKQEHLQFSDILPQIAADLSAIVASILILMVTFVLTEMLLGASPAKFLLGMRIMDESGEEASFSQLWMRSVFKNAIMLSLLVCIITIPLHFAYFSIAILVAGGVAGTAARLGTLLALRECRQTLHDTFTTTAVFR